MMDRVGANPRRSHRHRPWLQCSKLHLSLRPLCHVRLTIRSPSLQSRQLRHVDMNIPANWHRLMQLMPMSHFLPQKSIPHHQTIWTFHFGVERSSLCTHFLCTTYMISDPSIILLGRNQPIRANLPPVTVHSIRCLRVLWLYRQFHVRFLYVLRCWSQPYTFTPYVQSFLPISNPS